MGKQSLCHRSWVGIRLPFWPETVTHPRLRGRWSVREALPDGVTQSSGRTNGTVVVSALSAGLEHLPQLQQSGWLVAVGGTAKVSQTATHKSAKGEGTREETVLLSRLPLWRFLDGILVGSPPLGHRARLGLPDVGRVLGDAAVTGELPRRRTFRIALRVQGPGLAYSSTSRRSASR